MKREAAIMSAQKEVTSATVALKTTAQANARSPLTTLMPKLRKIIYAYLFRCCEGYIISRGMQNRAGEQPRACKALTQVCHAFR